MTTTFTTTEPGSARSKRRMAEQLLMQGIGGEPIQHWTQGLANMAKAALGGYELNQLDKEERDGLSLYGQAPGLPVAGVPAQATPAQPLPVAAPSKPPQAPPVSTAPMASGTAPPVTGPRPGGPVMPSNKWWGDNEAETAELYEPKPGARLASAIAPTTTAPTAPAQPVAPVPQSAVPNIPPEVGGYIQKLLGNPHTRQQGLALYGQYTKPSEYGFQTLPDGTIVRTDARRGTIEPAYRGETKPTFGDIGTDPNTGQPMKGFIDPTRRAVQPYQPPTSGAPSTLPPVPAGVDPKIWREKQSERVVGDAMAADTKTTSALRNEVQGLPSYKNMAQAAPVYKSMVDAASRDNRAADVNLIYGMAKIMDPGSVVRESEMTVAQAVATMPQQLRATVESQMTSAGRLSPEVRAAIMQEARSRVSAYQGQFDQDASMYRGIAQRGRMNEADVIPSFGEFKDYTPAPKQDAAKKALKNKYGLE